MGVIILEFLMVVLVIIGLIYEKRLIEFEDKLGAYIGKKLRKYYIKRK
jgi:hypothetical protein